MKCYLESIDYNNAPVSICVPLAPRLIKALFSYFEGILLTWVCDGTMV